MAEGIITTPTAEQRKDFIPIFEPGKRKSIKEEFEEKLAEEQQKALKKGLPFCDRAARDDFTEGYENQAKASLRKNGFVRNEDIKPVKIDWAKYSNLSNFDVLDEGEVSDEYLTKKNPGLDVTCKKTIYQFKGYSNKYTIMEDSPSAIRRARNKVEELREITKKK